MPNRSRKQPAVKKPGPTKRAKQARDTNQMAYDLVRHVEEMGATPDGKNLLAVALGRMGGLKGGRARADKLSPEERRASALKAARSRWDKGSN